MRREDKEVSQEQAMEWLKSGSSGVLSLVRKDGAPYGVPMSYVYHADAIWFHCAKEGEKLDCIAHCDDASFCVFTDHFPIPERYSVRYDSVIVTGKVCVVHFEPMLEDVLIALCRKYTPGHSQSEIERAIKASITKVCLIRLSVDSITGKQSGS